jgi:hypothetical protein
VKLGLVRHPSDINSNDKRAGGTPALQSQPHDHSAERRSFRGAACAFLLC